jgi:uncharacterized protein (DUF983 family)
MEKLCESCEINKERCKSCEDLSNYKQRDSTPLIVYLVITIILIIVLSVFFIF